MRSTNFAPLDLSDYEISPEQGFLPQDPLGHLPDSPTLNDLGHELPKLLSARTVRRFIGAQRQLLPSIPPTWRTEDYRAAMRILSFAGHAYVWEVPDQPVATLPPHLAKPWHEVAQRLGRYPVLSYASYALDNWRRLDQTKPISSTTLCCSKIFSAVWMKNGLSWSTSRSSGKRDQDWPDSYER